MTIKMKSGFLALALLAVFSGTAFAHVTLEIIGYGSASDMSADGSVIVGVSNGDYETWRWTPSTGVVLLGQNSLYAGGGAGTPDVSKDGTRVSATVLSADSTAVTAGLWTEGSGWQDLMPPVPPDGGMIDGAHGSAWGMSGDGNVVTGLYWRGGATVGGTAHGFRWTEATGVVSMVDPASYDSRINDADYDGNVLVGWSANPGFRNWWPTVWVDGVQTVLDTSHEQSVMLSGVNDDGTILLGNNKAPDSDLRGAAIWRWNGVDWAYEYVGALFATHPIFGSASLTACTPDGSIVVGYNAFDPGNSEGIMYTEADGLIDISQWLLAHGVNTPPDFKIRSLVAITDDGSMVCGTGQELVYPYGFKFFRIHLEDEDATDAPLARRTASLGNNYPNPFNPSTTIPVVLERGEVVQLEIYDVRGQKVRTLHSGVLAEGRHDFVWNGTDESGATVSSGTYMARLRLSDGAEQSSRMVLVK